MKKLYILITTILLLIFLYSFKSTLYNELVYNFKLDTKFNIKTSQDKNYKLNYIIDKKEYSKLNKYLKISLEDFITTRYDFTTGQPEKNFKIVKTFNIETKKALFLNQDNKYYLKINIIKYSNKKLLYILLNDTEIKDNKNFYEINEISTGNNYNITFTNTQDTPKLNYTYENYEKFYISSIYNLSLDNILKLNNNYDKLGIRLNYDILKDDYTKNEHLENDYNIHLAYYDYTDNKKIINYKIKTLSNINKYLITTKTKDNEILYTIFVSSDYLLIDKDFIDIKNIFFDSENYNIEYVKNDYENYLSDSYTIGNNYKIKTYIQNITNQNAELLTLNIEVVNSNIFNNSKNKIIYINSKKTILKYLSVVIIILAVIGGIFIFIKVKRRIKK